MRGDRQKRGWVGWCGRGGVDDEGGGRDSGAGEMGDGGKEERWAGAAVVEGKEGRFAWQRRLGE